MSVEVEDAVIYKRYNDGKVGCLELNKSQSLNAVDESILDKLEFYIEQANNTKKLRVLILKSNLLKAFSAGVNVKILKGYSNKKASYFFERIAIVLEGITQLPVITIAAVNGMAFGAGADIALSCDLRIANKKAIFQFPGSQFGAVLGTHRLVNEVGYSKARMLALMNKRINATEALDMGLIHKISNEMDCFESALKTADSLLVIPDFTLKSITNITTSQESELEPVEVAKQSILNGEFHKRFDNYLNKLRKN